MPKSGDLLENVTGANLFYVATATFWDGSRGTSCGSSAICAVREEGRVFLKLCGDCSLAGLHFQPQQKEHGQIEDVTSTSGMVHSSNNTVLCHVVFAFIQVVHEVETW